MVDKRDCLHQLRSIALTAPADAPAAPGLRLSGLHWLREHARLPGDALPLLNELAAASLPAAIKDLYGGRPVNVSEQRPALHMALRAEDPAAAGMLDEATAREVLACRAQFLNWAEHLHHGNTPSGAPVTDILHIGIGGSDLSPRLLARALATPDTVSAPTLHFLSAPAGHWPLLKERLNPATTQVIVVSKSLGTRETLHNWRLVRDWQRQALPEIVVTAATDKAGEQGIDAAHLLRMWSWVGGRYSFASAVSLAAAAGIGRARFSELLAGAEQMDQHFRDTGLEANLPVQLALLDYWNHIVRRFPGRGIFTYCSGLELLPAWLQQLEMESNGKSVTAAGKPLPGPSAPLIFGGSGPDAQHALYQMLHQGERDWPLELVGVLPETNNDTRNLLFAQLLGQMQTFVLGADHNDPQRRIPGRRPVSAMLLDEPDARTLGMLLACYEHKTFCFGTLIGCNPFDQWGVEAGKQAADRILEALRENRASSLEGLAGRLYRQLCN